MAFLHGSSTGCGEFDNKAKRTDFICLFQNLRFLSFGLLLKNLTDFIPIWEATLILVVWHLIFISEVDYKV
jgi:hypothetical protein